MRVTYSKLHTFDQCALKYRLAYIEHLPSPPTNTLAFANRMHTVLKRSHMHAKTDGEVDEAKLLATLESVWDEAGCGRGQKSGFVDGVDMLTLYAERENKLRRVPVLVEQKMKVDFGPYTLTGKIDRIDFADDGTYRIVDYKLHKTLPAEDAAAQSRQLSFYALLAKQTQGLSISEVSLYYLRHGRELIAKRTDEQLEETVHWIDRTAAAIREEVSWKPREGVGCATCAFKRVCPKKTGKPRPLQGKHGQYDLFGSDE